MSGEVVTFGLGMIVGGVAVLVAMLFAPACGSRASGYQPSSGAELFSPPSGGSSARRP